MSPRPRAIFTPSNVAGDVARHSATGHADRIGLPAEQATTAQSQPMRGARAPLRNTYVGVPEVFIKATYSTTDGNRRDGNTEG